MFFFTSDISKTAKRYTELLIGESCNQKIKLKEN